MVQISPQAAVPYYGNVSRKAEKPDLSAANFVTNKLEADSAIKSVILKFFNGTPKFQSSFESGFFSEMRKADEMHLKITNENGMHNALVSVIMQNRDFFQGGQFTIKTDLPGGGSIETIIPGNEEVGSSALPNLGASVNKLSALLSDVSDVGGMPANVAIQAYSSAE